MAEAIEVLEAQTKLQAVQNRRIQHVQGIVLLVILGILIAIIFATVSSSGGEFLLKLKDIETARGLITFLVVVTPISIALILSVYVMASNEDIVAIKERFTYAKDVLAILVGILGTVLGFYYGALNKGDEQTFSIDAQFPGNQIIAHISGATPPYRYKIIFPGEQSKNASQKVSKDGWITEALPSTLKKDDSIQFDIVDSKDKKLSKAIKYVLEEKQVVAPKETLPVAPAVAPVPKPTPPVSKKPLKSAASLLPSPKASS